MREKSHKYDITQCALYKKKSSKQLKKVLCITEEEYKDILWFEDQKVILILIVSIVLKLHNEIQVIPLVFIT